MPRNKLNYLKALHIWRKHKVITFRIAVKLVCKVTLDLQQSEKTLYAQLYTYQCNNVRSAMNHA